MRRSLQDDLYRLTTSWPRFIAAAATSFVLLNAMFAGLYAMTGGGVLGARTFGDLFFFSIETFATVGFGDTIPRTAPARVIATTEAFTSIATLALATGLIFARFARPAASILFAPRLAFGAADGSFSLMARLANGRRDAIIDATARMWLVWLERYGDVETRRYRELILAKPDHPVFLQTWKLFHVIDASSPLNEKNEAELRAPHDVVERQQSALSESNDDGFLGSSAGVSTVLRGLRGPIRASAVVERDRHLLTVVRLSP